VANRRSRVCEVKSTMQVIADAWNHAAGLDAKGQRRGFRRLPSEVAIKEDTPSDDERPAKRARIL
jgi:hypothetical protein